MGDPPDLILLAGTVLTNWPALPRAEAVAVKDGLVEAVGSRREILRRAGSGTRVVDRPELCALPGFNDAHLHLVACARRRLAVDCGPSRVHSIGQIQEAIRRRACGLPPGRWIRAEGYDEFWLAERRHPTRWELDAAAPEHPVRLVHRSHHACVMNSAALRAVGLGQEGYRRGRTVVDIDPATSESTGLVFEYGGDESSEDGGPSAEAELRLSLQRVLGELVAAGVTSVQDAGAANGLGEWERFRQLRSWTGPRPRIGFMVGSAHLDRFVQAGMGPGFGDDWLRVGAVKMMLTEEGDSFHPPVEELARGVRRARDLGYQAAIHAVEESTICIAAEVLAEAPPLSGRPAHRIEHCSVLPLPLLERLAELRLSVATQPAFLYHSGDRYLSQVEGHLHGWLYPLGSMLRGGLQVGAGSDAPVAPFNPLESIRAAVTRQSIEGRVLGESERLSVQEALWLHTGGAAAVSGEGHRKGTLEPGKLADLALLSADPTAVEPQEIDRIQVEMTIIGGEVVWERSGLRGQSTDWRIRQVGGTFARR